MNPNSQPTIMLVGSDATLAYLFGRFAERSGYQLTSNTASISIKDVATVKPAAVIFLSTELLARNQALVAELTSLDSPILVCSSIAEETWARELGADYCLFHPLTLGDFQTALIAVTASKRV